MRFCSAIIMFIIKNNSIIHPLIIVLYNVFCRMFGSFVKEQLVIEVRVPYK